MRHGTFETITDPWPASNHLAWVDRMSGNNTGDEIADLCAGEFTPQHFEGYQTGRGNTSNYEWGDIPWNKPHGENSNGGGAYIFELQHEFNERDHTCAETGP